MSAHSAPSGESSPIGIAGAGRAARALGAALTRAGLEVVLWARADDRARSAARAIGARPIPDLAALARTARAVLVAISDDALADFAALWASSWPKDARTLAALHTAGAWPSIALAPLAQHGVATGVFHPALALQGEHDAATLRGAHATVSGDAGALRVARDLAQRLGMHAHEIDDAARPLAHLAFVMGAGDIVALLGAAERVLARAGLAAPNSRTILAALARSAVAGFEAQGAKEGMTGPVARADHRTLAAHEGALARAGLTHAPEAAAHRALIDAARALLGSGDELPGAGPSARNGGRWDGGSAPPTRRGGS